MRRAAVLLAIAGCLPEAYESERTVEWELPAPPARDVIDRFQACMTPTSFIEAGMQRWAGWA